MPGAGAITADSQRGEDGDDPEQAVAHPLNIAEARDFVVRRSTIGRTTDAVLENRPVKLTLDQVRHVAKLARLKLTPEEELKHQQQLSQVLEAFEALSKIDTTDVPPTYHVNLEHTTLREDVVETPLTVDEALANAPQRVGDSFGVPKVIE